MSAGVQKAAAWVYEGLWGVLADLFRVPREAPTLPIRPGEHLEQFHPAPGYLQYLKFWFWVMFVVIDLAILVGWIAILAASPLAGVLLAPVALFLAIAPDVVAYVAIHLRYDTMWYVMSPRSMRLRRGIWIINEVTITFENVQNVRVTSGPVQRWFGIANVVVETAGAGTDEHGAGISNQGILEGVGDAARIRDLVMARVKASRTSGLGDEAPPAGFTPEHVEVLREIRDLVGAA